jgi:hypothetical protein
MAVARLDGFTTHNSSLRELFLNMTKVAMTAAVEAKLSRIMLGKLGPSWG